MTTSDLSPELRKVADRAKNLGLAPELVAEVLDIPAHVVRAMRVYSTRTDLTPEDEELADATRKIVRLGLDGAYRTLMFGHPDQRFRLQMALVSRAASLIGMQTSTRVDELRAEISQLGASLADDDHDYDELNDDDGTPFRPHPQAVHPHDPN